MHDKDTPVSALIGENISPDEAKQLFKTEFDEPIQQMLSALKHLGYTQEDFALLLDAMKELMEATIDVPRDITVEESMPYVYVSDLLILGALSAEAYKRRDLIEEVIAAEQGQ